MEAHPQVDLDSMTIDELKDYIRNLQSESNKRDEEYTQLENEYENIIADLNQQLLKARGKIISQDITLASYKEKTGIPIIIEGPEHDLYRGEQRDYVLNLIRNAQKELPKNVRAYRICESLLEANNVVGVRQKIQDVVQSCLENYSGMTKSILYELRNVGIDVQTCSNNHYKLLLGGDERYPAIISATPSSKRSGPNNIMDVNRMFF